MRNTPHASLGPVRTGARAAKIPSRAERGSGEYRAEFLRLEVFRCQERAAGARGTGCRHGGLLQVPSSQTPEAHSAALRNFIAGYAVALDQH